MKQMIKKKERSSLNEEARKIRVKYYRARRLALSFANDLFELRMENDKKIIRIPGDKKGEVFDEEEHKKEAARSVAENLRKVLTGEEVLSSSLIYVETMAKARSKTDNITEEEALAIVGKETREFFIENTGKAPEDYIKSKKCTPPTDT